MTSPLRHLAHRLLDLPPARGSVAVDGEAPMLPHDHALRVVVWNIQFCAGRSRLFFYDGGRAVSVSPDDVAHTADAIGHTLRELDADLVLLQEVDRCSDRTGRVDQVDLLRARCPYPVTVATPYFQVRYVPHPSHEHLGRVHTDLVIFSRFRIAAAFRHPLCPLDEPAWRRAFNLRRAVLVADLPREGGGVVTVMNTHLSAFSRGDGTVERQVAELEALCDGATGPWLLAGDLNSLPPGQSPAGLPDAQLYGPVGSPVGSLYDRYQAAMPLDAYRADPSRYYTYQRVGGSPDRVLDYAFAGGMRDVRVDVHPTDHSDHLPLLVTATPR